MRLAAVKAGLVPTAAAGDAQVEFVSEGEASFHWCVDMGWATAALSVRFDNHWMCRNTLSNSWAQLGNNVVIADAGGGTIDVSCFKVISTTPLRLEEHAVAACRSFPPVYRPRLKHSRRGFRICFCHPPVQECRKR